MAKPAINNDWSLLPGLSGNSWRPRTQQDEIHRLTPLQPLPFVNRQREYRILRKLRGARLGSKAKGFAAGELRVEWTQGRTLAPSDFSPENTELIALLIRLHQHPLLGYRLPLVTLLQRYWQLCRQRHPGWLSELQRLQRRGEPHPLRLVPLHMDLHPGNVITTDTGLVLIDWEYSADGDIALELATLCLQDADQATAWITAYAQAFSLDTETLRIQVKRWQPWLRLLQASWYQLKAEQTQQPLMKQLATQSWQTLLSS